MSDQRLHIDDVNKIPEVGAAFGILAGVLVSFKRQDMEADFEIGGHQFHLEIAIVNEDISNETSNSNHNN